MSMVSPVQSYYHEGSPIQWVEEVY